MQIAGAHFFWAIVIPGIFLNVGTIGIRIFVSQDGSAALWTLHATQWRHVLLLPTEEQADGKKLKVNGAKLFPFSSFNIIVSIYVAEIKYVLNVQLY